MKQFERSTGYQLLKTATLVDFRVGKPTIEACTDGENLALTVVLVLSANDDEDPADIAEWASFGLVYALAVQSFADARPRGASGMDFTDNDEFTVSDLFDCLRFVDGELRFTSDYLRGRCMKTDITVRKDGQLTLYTRLRGQSALRWLDRIQGKRALTLL